MTFDEAPLRFRFIEHHVREENLFRRHPDLFWELRPGFPDPVGTDAPNEDTFRGPLLAPERLRAIWRLNTGAYDHRLTRYLERRADRWLYRPPSRS